MKKSRFIILSALILLIAFLYSGCDEYPNSGVNLSALTISEGALDPEFSSSVTSYAVALDSGTASITVTPTASDEGSVIEVDDVAVASGTESEPVTLAEGVNTIEIKVTSSDGSTTKTYTLTVTVGITTPAVEDGKITVNLVNASSRVGEFLGFAVFEDNDIDWVDPAASGGYEILADGTAGGVAYVDPYIETPVEFVAEGGALYDVYAVIDLDDSETLSLNDYAFIVEDVYIDGDTECTIDFTDMDLYTAPDSSIVVSLINGAASQGNLFGFSIFTEDMTPVNANAGFVIVADGTGAAVAMDSASGFDPFLAADSTAYKAYVFIDEDGDENLSDGDLYGTISFTTGSSGYTTVEVDYGTDLSTYSETIEVDGSIVVSLTGGAASEGEILTFGVYDSSQTPGIDPPSAYGTFAIDSAGTGSAPALDSSDDAVFVGTASETYTITVLIDSDLSGTPDAGELIGSDTVTVTGTGAEAVELDYTSFSAYSEP